MDNKTVVSLQEFRHRLQNSKLKVFVFESEAQPGFDCTDPVSIKVYCWFREVWPQTKTVVLKTNNGEICIRRVRCITVEAESPSQKELVTFSCDNLTNPQKPHVFRLTEF